MSETLLENCSGCYEITLAECLEDIIVDAGLAPATEHVYTITDKFGNKYTNQLTTGTDGKFTIHTADLKPGIFMSFSGAFTLQVFAQQQSCQPETLTLCGTDYTCVVLEFEKISAEELTGQTIPCGCE